tara:strand:+ start:886 stop:1173 length:288 start_codon:yes stop_codon:yes gene_type:complete
MIMMGPKKDKGGMISIIIEKMKNGESLYEEGKEHNEEFRQKPEHEEHEVYEHYKEEVDGMLDAIKKCVKGEGDEMEYKEEFSKCLKMFIKKCVKE